MTDTTQYAEAVADVARAFQRLAEASVELAEASHPRRPLSKAYAIGTEAYARYEARKLTEHFCGLDMSSTNRAPGEFIARVE